MLGTLAGVSSQPNTKRSGHSVARVANERSILTIVSEFYTACINQGETGGEGGIRTLGSLLDYGALAKRCFRPLSHLTIHGLHIFVFADMQVENVSPESNSQRLDAVFTAS